MRDEWVNEIRKDPTVRELTKEFDDTKSSVRRPIDQLREALQRRSREIEETLDEATEIYSEDDHLRVEEDDTQPHRQMDSDEMHEAEAEDTDGEGSDDRGKP